MTRDDVARTIACLEFGHALAEKDRQTAYAFFFRLAAETIVFLVENDLVFTGAGTQPGLPGPTISVGTDGKVIPPEPKHRHSYVDGKCGACGAIPRNMRRGQKPLPGVNGDVQGKGSQP